MLFVLVFSAIIYFYQQNPMVSGEAIVQSVDHLQNPPAEWANSIPPLDWQKFKQLPPENIRATLNRRDGIWYTFLNRKQWEVTIKYNGTEPTVVFDATTGNLIDLNGPLN